LHLHRRKGIKEGRRASRRTREEVIFDKRFAGGSDLVGSPEAWEREELSVGVRETYKRRYYLKSGDKSQACACHEE